MVNQYAIAYSIQISFLFFLRCLLQVIFIDVRVWFIHFSFSAVFRLYMSLMIFINLYLLSCRIYTRWKCTKLLLQSFVLVQVFKLFLLQSLTRLVVNLFLDFELHHDFFLHGLRWLIDTNLVFIRFSPNVIKFANKQNTCSLTLRSPLERFWTGAFNPGPSFSLITQMRNSLGFWTDVCSEPGTSRRHCHLSTVPRDSLYKSRKEVVANGSQVRWPFLYISEYIRLPFPPTFYPLMYELHLSTGGKRELPSTRRFVHAMPQERRQSQTLNHRVTLLASSSDFCFENLNDGIRFPPLALFEIVKN